MSRGSQLASASDAPLRARPTTTASDRAEQRREQILRAAERVFVDKGYHAAGIADIAKLLGIGHGTFYRYFKNKHDIATTVLQQAVTRIVGAALDEDPSASTDLASYRAQTKRVLTRMLRLAEEYPLALRFFHRESRSVDPELLDRVLDNYVAFTIGFLHNGVARGFLRENLDLRSTAEALVALIFEGTRRALFTYETAKGRERWVSAGIALMFDGVRAR